MLLTALLAWLACSIVVSLLWGLAAGGTRHTESHRLK
jgi:hypothetical protein